MPSNPEFSNAAADDDIDSDKHLSTEEDEPKKVKRSINYVEELDNLWEIKENHINLYTVTFDSENWSFTWNTLKEFHDPVGVFIIADSNFNPPLRPSQSN